MTNWEEFLNCNRGLLIAPAGHGKTTAIADCVLRCPDNKCQLVLTHTHAGIASLKSKFRKKNIPSRKYQLETITGFAQRYVLSILGSSALPSEEDKEYFDVAVEKCCSLLESSTIQSIIKISYDGVFVDEYQDCTMDQHDMILSLASNLPLHLFGDPLQGIFSFENKPLIDFQNELTMFTCFDLLKYPWRWHETNPALGRYIFNIRKEFEAGGSICLNKVSTNGVSVILCTNDDNDKYDQLAKIIHNLKSDNVLVLYPLYKYNKNGTVLQKGLIHDRILLKQRIDFANKFSIIDAIDSREYYKCASIIDSYIEQCRRSKRSKRVARLYDLLDSFHLNVTELKKWIDRKGNRFKKRSKENYSLSEKLNDCFSFFESDINPANLRKLINMIMHLPKIKCYHWELYQTIDRCFELANLNTISMREAMRLYKSRLRHQGRKINGCCIGTTLLTKGLEFDTVILWDAHRFEDAKNFYVAISRACKQLIIMTEKDTLDFGGKK